MHTYNKNHAILLSIKDCILILFLEYVILAFEHRSGTQKDEDYVCIYKDSSLTDHWGSLADRKLSGLANTGWPGAGGRPPLVIPADRFVVHFHSGPGRGKPCEWGFKLNAVAPVSIASSRTLKEEFRSAGASTYMTQRALVDTNNNLDQAR